MRSEFDHYDDDEEEEDEKDEEDGSFHILRFSGLTGNNCTYCGGSIEDNYPPAGLNKSTEATLYSVDIVVLLGQTIALSSSSQSLDPNNDDHRNYSDCRGSVTLPLRHHRLLHAQGETVCKMQSHILHSKLNSKAA